MLFDLIYASPKYRDLSIAEIYDSILAAHKHNKMLVWTYPNGLVSGFMTYAFLSDEKAKAVATGKYTVRNDDFVGYDGQLWVMDFIAPHGNVPKMMRDAQHYFAEIFGDGTLVRWKRPHKTPQKLGWCYARKVYDVAA